MLSQSQVDQWLADLCLRLKNMFGGRLVFVGHIGSWARAEPHEASDIDCLITLDIVSDEDIYRLRDIFHEMPGEGIKPGGILVSLKELNETPAFHMRQLFFHGCKAVYGSIEGLVTRPSTDDYLTDIRMKACDNLHIARHLLMFSGDLSKSIFGLKSNFYGCFFALQNWILITQHRYVERKEDILRYLHDPRDTEVVRVAHDWYEIKEDLGARAPHYVELLERWSRGMLNKLESYKSE